MSEELPIACSLETVELGARLEAIAELGDRSLLGRAESDGRHLLRFRGDSETRGRLEEIVAAEALCCAFLELELSDEDGEVVLSIAAPEEGRPTADGLAAAFGPA